MDRTVRLFIAIDLPPEVKRLLRSTQTRLIPHLPGVRWIDPDGAHLTLKFLGDTPDGRVDEIVAGLARATAGLRPFRLHTDALGAFPSARRPRVIWIGLDGNRESLHMTHAAVEREIAPLGFPMEDRPFNPHLTLGRVHRDARPAELTQIAQVLASTKVRESVAFAVEELILMRSELSRSGARYTAIAQSRLDEAR